VCIALCTIVAHKIAQNRPDNFPRYLPDNHHCSDAVYLKEGGPSWRRVPCTERVTCRRAVPASLLATHSYRPLSLTDTADSCSDPLLCTVHRAPLPSSSTPSFDHVTSGLGRPTASHASRTRDPTVAATSGSSSSIVGVAGQAHTVTLLHFA